MIRILIADDHQMMRDGLKSMLQDEDDMEIVAEAENGKAALQAVMENDIDLAILDINMPEMDGVEVCKQITRSKKSTCILALTMYDEASIITNMVKNGARGYILKNAGKENLVKALRTIYAGDTYFPDQIKEAYFASLIPGDKNTHEQFVPKLTRREKEIIALIVDEFTTSEIADKLFISEKTVETHRQHLLQKFNVRNTAGLVRAAFEKGFIDNSTR